MLHLCSDINSFHKHVFFLRFDLSTVRLTQTDCNIRNMVLSKNMRLLMFFFMSTRTAK